MRDVLRKEEIHSQFEELKRQRLQRGGGGANVIWNVNTIVNN